MLDLVALATVADVAPLVGVNRAFVRQGLAVMARRQRAGLVALSDIAGWTARQARSTWASCWVRASMRAGAWVAPIWARCACPAATRRRPISWPVSWTR